MNLKPILLSIILVSASVCVAETYDHCYGRHYSIEHLKNNPSQDISSLLVYVGDDGKANGQFFLALQAVAVRNSLSVKKNTAGEVFESFAGCNTRENSGFGEDIFLDKSILVCGVDCDGGIGYVTQIDDKQMTLVSRGIRMDYRQSGDGGCGGELDPLELGFLDGKPEPDSRLNQKPITYILYRMDNAACADLNKLD